MDYANAKEEEVLMTTPGQRKAELFRLLLDRNNKRQDAEEKRNRRSQVISNVGQAVENMVRARSQAIGGQGTQTGFYDNVRDQANQRLAGEENRRNLLLKRVMMAHDYDRLDDKAAIDAEERAAAQKERERKATMDEKGYGLDVRRVNLDENKFARGLEFDRERLAKAEALDRDKLALERQRYMRQYGLTEEEMRAKEGRLAQELGLDRQKLALERDKFDYLKSRPDALPSAGRQIMPWTLERDPLGRMYQYNKATGEIIPYEQGSPSMMEDGEAPMKIRPGETEMEFQERLKAKYRAPKQAGAGRSGARSGGGAEGGGGKPVTAGDAAKIAELDAADKLIDNAEREYMALASGRGSGLKSYLPFTDARKYDENRANSAQVIGGIIEGGKLTDADFARYTERLPSPFDTNDKAKYKFDQLRKILKEKRNAVVNTLGDVGYNVGVLREDESGRRTSGPVPAMPNEPAKPMTQPVQNQPAQPAQNQLSDEDRMYLDWARKNPSDPAAQEILKLHGGGQ